jgi:hypothetical protein
MLVRLAPWLLIGALGVGCATLPAVPTRTPAEELPALPDGAVPVWFEEHLGSGVHIERIVVLIDGALVLDRRETVLASTLLGQLHLATGDHTLSILVVTSAPCDSFSSARGSITLRDSFSFTMQPPPQKPPAIALDLHRTGYAEALVDDLRLHFDVSNQRAIRTRPLVIDAQLYEDLANEGQCTRPGGLYDDAYCRFVGIARQQRRSGLDDYFACFIDALAAYRKAQQMLATGALDPQQAKRAANQAIAEGDACTSSGCSFGPSVQASGCSDE